MSNGDPIIIKGGGSIEVHLSKDTFPPDETNRDKHYNGARRVTRMYVTEDSTGKVTDCALPEDGRFTIKIEHSL